ncbi:MAG: poly-gamma-glutamate synthase PgsB [Candidatus Aminicenantes bacterium]|nr:poly-gamma-glutamate synthase PgsB [Candidatus Aminicenantes bacterium]
MLMVWLLIFFLAWMAYLFFEALSHQRSLRKIPHRIAITGIRGKSSITRLIAAGLREAGYRVVAKTTGSRPVIIYPDGREEEIKRKGRPSVLEQKKLMQLAASQSADFLVVEMMSIQPEFLRAESHKLLQPETLVISNIRVDHTEFLGQSREEVALHLSASLKPGLKVFIPREEMLPALVGELQNNQVEIIAVRPHQLTEELKSQVPYAEFEPNLTLALEVLAHYRVPFDRIKEGFRKVCPDFGHLRIWQVSAGSGAPSFYFVNLLAANDPASTAEALKLVEERFDFSRRQTVGLLSLRSDRPDRTKQWLDYFQRQDSFEESILNRLGFLFITGPGSAVVSRKLSSAPGCSKSRVKRLKARSPEDCLAEIFNYLKNCQPLYTEENKKNASPTSSYLGTTPLNQVEKEEKTSISEKEIVIIGIGNIVGFGQKLIDYLEREGHAFKL